ncbi:head maturation protease, ClpP-related [Microbacterium sp. IEGM 1404]|uniref:head maturation protease, ClpP-related n=1 Tax=Microbacterium sp. IEGM 1404 TaxID=3047084 RepID=UPI0024B81B67|nr:head maturation protease, ClpP-related [Microbacterium sp. IEGM 1404]MDI9889966.1 ATP-dependent Clp protease proteolytic subunit [Microbacterium sp. IEGM 1404]
MTTTPNIGDLLAGRDWFRLQQEEGARSAVLHVYGSIGSSEWWDDVSSPSLVRELDGIDVDEITMYVNSPGGIADDGVAIMNALARNSAKVTAYVDGLAASAASIVILGADEIVMGAGSRLMIHDAWSITWGQASTIQKTAERLDKLSQTLAGLYAQRAGGDADSWRAAMVEETWYTAEEAVEAGLADRVATIHAGAEDDDESAALNVIPIADAARAFGWRHPGREAASAPFIPPRPAAQARAAAPTLPSSTEPGDPNRKENAVAYSDLTAGLRERLGVTDADATDDELLAALDEALEEQAENTSTSTAAEGTVTVDATVWEETQANARRGAEARAEQDSTRRDGIVADALRTGRITAKSKADWRARLDKDEKEYASVLASLPENGAVAVNEIGHSDSLTSADDALYAAFVGDEKED